VYPQLLREQGKERLGTKLGGHQKGKCSAHKEGMCKRNRKFYASRNPSLKLTSLKGATDRERGGHTESAGDRSSQTREKKQHNGGGEHIDFEEKKARCSRGRIKAVTSGRRGTFMATRRSLIKGGPRKRKRGNGKKS